MTAPKIIRLDEATTPEARAKIRDRALAQQARTRKSDRLELAPLTASELRRATEIVTRREHERQP